MKRSPTDRDYTGPSMKSMIEDGCDDISSEPDTEPGIAVHKTAQNSLQSPLLRLPRELRDKIWKFAFGDQTLRVGWAPEPWRSRSTVFEKSNAEHSYYVPQLISKQYWAETSDVFLKSCTLAFDDASAFEDFVLCLKPIVAQIRRISISMTMRSLSADSADQWEYILSGLPFGDLKSLEGLHMKLQIYNDEDFGAPENIMARNRNWDDFRQIIGFFQQHKLKEDLTQIRIEDCSGSKHDTEKLSDMIRKHLLDCYAGVEGAGPLA